MTSAGTPLVPRGRSLLHERSSGPGFGSITNVDGPEPSPDGRASWPSAAKRSRSWRARRAAGSASAATDGSGWRQITAGPNDDVQPRWSPDGTTLTFLSDRVAEGTPPGLRARGRLVRRGSAAGRGPGVRRAPPLVPRRHAPAPGGRRRHAEQADALGSGTLGPADEEAPRWLPDVESTDDADEWRRLWVLDVATGEARCVSRERSERLGGILARERRPRRRSSPMRPARAPGTRPRSRCSTSRRRHGAVVATSDVQLNFARGRPTAARSR